ncbi:Protein YjgL, putative CCAAT-box DNA binding protein [Escherichia coli]|uniref:Protein YjgL, putative CCAAT-box DNA binding protein n=1 Tax=Escherichia coli TaxID=562 RepID=A0A484YFR7_ECOLX|nr:Protein YjgL, putative CCAAT-box DNA binding protein [Escherichia coli]
MSKISDLNYSQHITLADNFKQKSEVLNTWRVGMNDFARIAGGQDSRRNILSAPEHFWSFWQKYLPWVMWILANAPTKRVEI